MKKKLLFWAVGDGAVDCVDGGGGDGQRERREKRASARENELRAGLCPCLKTLPLTAMYEAVGHKITSDGYADRSYVRRPRT